MAEQEVDALRTQIDQDRKLIRRAERALGEIDRGHGLSDEHADVLAALRIRLEGKPRTSLEDLLTAAGDIGGKKELGEVLASDDDKDSKEWPEITQKKKEWPGA
jgi:hypothetical protein